MNLRAIEDATRAFVQQNLAELCRELANWQDSGVSPKGPYLELVGYCEKWVGSANAQDFAQSLVQASAVQSLANAAALATRQPSEPAKARVQAFEDAARWFKENDPDGERYYASHVLWQMAEGTVDPPLSA